MTPLTVIFIGPQGSGKGTQIEKLDQVLRQKDPTREVVDVQTGRRFRALAARQENYTEKHVGETLNSGILQPLFLSVMLWGDAFRTYAGPDCHLLIDGFPRTLHEALVLESALAFYQRTPLTIINLDTPEAVVEKRMHGRARPDDTPESIAARLAWYRTETKPVLDYYRSREHTTVFDVDGTLDIAGVHAAILNYLALT